MREAFGTNSFQELKAFRGHFGQHDRDAGNTASGPTEIGDEPASYGVGADRHHNRDGRGRLHGSADGHRNVSHNDVRL
jgi:hypothetical protein